MNIINLPQNFTLRSNRSCKSTKKGGVKEGERGEEEVRSKDTRGMGRGREWKEDIEGTEGRGL